MSEPVACLPPATTSQVGILDVAGALVCVYMRTYYEGLGVCVVCVHPRRARARVWGSLKDLP